MLTTPQRPEQAVLDGMRSLLTDARAHMSDIDVFIHGTTLATNAIIERRGAQVALIATDGFRDMLEIGTESRYDQYDLILDKPRPLAPRVAALPPCRSGSTHDGAVAARSTRRQCSALEAVATSGRRRVRSASCTPTPMRRTSGAGAILSEEMPGCP